MLLRKTPEKRYDEDVAGIKRWLSMKGNREWILACDNMDNLKLTGTHLV